MKGLFVLLALLSGATPSLDKGVKALEEFRAEAALRHLEAAKKEGPYTFEETIRLHEQLGVAYAYLEKPDQALEEFQTVLALSPGHAISYTLSPKVTFLFQKARQEASTRRATTVDVSWPRGLDVDSSVPLDIEVVADPLKVLDKAKINYRVRGHAEFSAVELELTSDGKRQAAEIPPIAEGAEESTAIELYLSAYDTRGNEVLRWGSQSYPREITLEPADAWYEKWWIWTIVGGAVAAGTGTAVFFATREPSPTVPAVLEVIR